MKKSFYVDETYSGMRIDRWIRKNFGNLPQGRFKVVYRTSANKRYTIKPSEMTGIQIQITPTSATNRIVVEGQFCCHCDNNAAGIYLAWDDGGNTLDYSASIEYYPGQGWRTIPVRYERIAGSTNQLTFTLMMYKYGNGTIYTGWSSSSGSSSVDHNGAFAVAYEVKE